MNSFTQTLRWLLLTNKRHYAKSFVYLCVAFFAIMGAHMGMFSFFSHEVNSFDAATAAVTVVLGNILASGIFASEVTFDLKTKQQRTLYLMVPASGNDKFWCRVLTAFLLGFVVSFVATCVADCFQMLLTTIFSGSHASVTAALVSYVYSNVTDIYGGNVFYNSLMLVSMAAWGFSSFLLGGFLFRKMPFVMTCIAWFLFWLIISVVLTVAAFFMNDKGIQLIITDADGLGPYINAVMSTAGLIFTVFNLWMSHLIHKRMTIVCNRMFNL